MTTEPTIHDKLSAPFDVGELKFFPQSTTNKRVDGRYPEGTKGRVASYIDARAVMDRLDEVLGWEAWSTEYEVIDSAMKAVRCTLTVSGVSKSDVGYPNEGKDASDANAEPFKAAYSDALKRAAVQFGIGRYIYSLELVQDWLPVDKYGKFTEQPRLKGSAPQRPVQPAQRSSAPPPAQPDVPLADALRASVDAIRETATFPGTSMVNGDGTLNFTEFWAQCRKHKIDNTAVAKEVGGDLNNLKTMSASAAVDVFNVLRDRQKEAASA